MSTPSLPTIYRHALRAAKRLPVEPSRGTRSLRGHVDATLYTVKKRTFTAADPAALWRQVTALEALVENRAMAAHPLSKRLTDPEGSPNHYRDLAANAGDADAKSTRTPLQSFLFKYFRLKL
ncbi:hypothetical protein H9P43_002991 [Blastocladiella emersonii ATCC 22665]|nr:hypothetical protein H9P43_002991 [Blastocladiella emersonii ATCC 22665]